MDKSFCSTPRRVYRLRAARRPQLDRKSTRLNSSHANISYAVFCLKKKTTVPVHFRDTRGNLAGCKSLKRKEEGTRRYTCQVFEELAGAISWGIKSPSPHQTF